MKTAFPTIKRAQYHNVSTTADEGMSLRDYFAAKALQGICARVQWSYSGAAKDAYAYADEMMKEREK